ncbi:MAG: hypothetical protein HC908_01620 [Calothrix sp. SM1_7_51]|nr:hypothetical protein [Calothrix sp. SM1_7_51]
MDRLTKTEAVERYGIPKRTLERLSSQGKLSVKYEVVDGQKRAYYDPEELEAAARELNIDIDFYKPAVVGDEPVGDTSDSCSELTYKIGEGVGEAGEASSESIVLSLILREIVTQLATLNQKKNARSLLDNYRDLEENSKTGMVNSHVNAA